MSTTQPTLAQELAAYNDHPDRCLRSTLGMSIKTWETIKATTQLIGVLGVLWLVTLPGELDPHLAALLITVILGGAETIEIIIQNANTEDKPPQPSKRTPLSTTYRHPSSMVRSTR